MNSETLKRIYEFLDKIIGLGDNPISETEKKKASTFLMTFAKLDSKACRVLYLSLQLILSNNLHGTRLLFFISFASSVVEEDPDSFFYL